jgi:hypothetical protein
MTNLKIGSFRLRWSLVVLPSALSLALTAGVASAATVHPTPRNPTALMAVAEHIKTIDPTLRESITEIAAHISSLQKDFRRKDIAQKIADAEGGNSATLNLNYWGGTWWFHRWDVAWMVTLSTAAVVAVLVYTCGITLTAVWGVVGGLIALFWSAFFAGYCAYVTPHPYHAGMYRC